MFEELYYRLNTKEGKRSIYKMAKIQERNMSDITNSNASRTEKIDFY